MWPFRPESLSDVFSDEELELVLAMAGDLGTSATLVQKGTGDHLSTHGRRGAAERARPDPFCTYFRHGREQERPAFRGADAVCAACEARLARRALQEESDESTDRRRCHMGLTDSVALVRVGGRTIGAVVAGRVVASEDDRQRIRKSVGKLGKLTRAEAAGDAAAKPAIEPASEAARDRLRSEIDSIPLLEEGFDETLAQWARRVGVLAESHYRGRAVEREDGILEHVRCWELGGTLTVGHLMARMRALLDEVREVLGMEFLALFSREPRGHDEAPRLGLTVHAGLDVATRVPPLLLDWEQLPERADGASSADFGRQMVAKTIRAVAPAEGAPQGLKDRLTKSVFFFPVELRPGVRGALAFGAPRNNVLPEPRDYEFLARLATAVVERYEALRLQVDYHRLKTQFERREERVGTLEREAAQERARRKDVELKKNYSSFDLVKLLEARVTRTEPAARERGVELDRRGMGEKARLYGDRRGLARALDAMLAQGVAQSHVPEGAAAASPLRVYVKRSADRVTVGVEAIGEFLSHAERMQLLGLPVRDGEPSRGGQRSRRRAPPRASPEAAAAIGVPPDPPPASDGSGPESGGPLADARRFARRHGGRLRLRSERLRRSENEAGRWLATTSLLLELPHSSRDSKPRRSRS